MILLDTNVLVAAARTADTNHHSAARLLETLVEPRLVPPTVVAEVCYLLSEWGGPDAEDRFCATSGRVAGSLAESSASLLRADAGGTGVARRSRRSRAAA